MHAFGTHCSYLTFHDKMKTVELLFPTVALTPSHLPLCPSQEHINYYCTGSSLGNLIMSLKHEEAEGQEFLRIILRYSQDGGSEVRHLCSDIIGYVERGK